MALKVDGSFHNILQETIRKNFYGKLNMRACFTAKCNINNMRKKYDSALNALEFNALYRFDQCG